MFSLDRSSKVSRFSSSSYPVVDIQVVLIVSSSLIFPLSLFFFYFSSFFSRRILLEHISWSVFFSIEICLLTPTVNPQIDVPTQERSRSNGRSRKFSSFPLRSISFGGLRFAITIPPTVVVRVALMSASGSIGSPQLFCSPIKVLSQRAARPEGGERWGSIDVGRGTVLVAACVSDDYTLSHLAFLLFFRFFFVSTSIDTTAIGIVNEPVWRHEFNYLRRIGIFRCDYKLTYR